MPPSSLSPSLEMAALPELPPARPSLGANSARQEPRAFDRVLSSCDETASRPTETPVVETESPEKTVPVEAAQQALAALLFVPARPELLPLRELIADPLQCEEMEGIEDLDTDEESDGANVLEVAGDATTAEANLAPTVPFVLPNPGARDVATADAAVASSATATAAAKTASESAQAGRDGMPNVWKNSLRATPNSAPRSAESGSIAIADASSPLEAAPLMTTRYREVPTASSPMVGEGTTTLEAEPLPAAALATSATSTPAVARPANPPTQSLARSEGEPIVDPLGAKNADAVVSRSAKEGTRGITPFLGKKEKILSVDNKVDTKLAALLGTDAANQGETSMSTHRQIPLEPVARAAELSVGACRTEATSETKAGLATQAVQVVEDIREISAGLNAHRRHVELNFDFGDQGRLEVRLDVRQGQIQTQFRTDSTEVREALQQAWNSQGLSSEGRARLAEPAFLPAQARSDSSSQQSFADAHSRQQRQASGESSAPAFFSRPTAAAPAGSPVVSVPVVASDRQLHAFA